MNDPFKTPSGLPLRGDASASRPLRPGDLSEAVPLHDALCGIGEVLQLPRKLPTAPYGVPVIGASSAARPATKSRNTKTIGMPAIPAPENAYAAARRAERRWLSGGVLGLAAVIVLVMNLGGDAPRRDPMPSALRTEWRTTHPSYAHTVLSFTDSTVQIVTRDLASESPDRPIRTQHVITGLVADELGEETLLVVHYLVDGEPDQIEARLVSGAAPSLEFVRPEGLTWYPVHQNATSR